MGLAVWYGLPPRPEEAGGIWAAIRLSQGLFPPACVCGEADRRTKAGGQISVVSGLLSFAAAADEAYRRMDEKKLNGPLWHGCICSLRPFLRWPGPFHYVL